MEQYPAASPRQTGLVTRHTLAEARAQQAERILLADDNRPNQMPVVRLLERRGYRVDVVAGGSEALAALAQQPYDLLFLDCFMPDMNGFETTRRIRSSEPPGQRIPIIALTANVLPEDRQKCLDVGMDDYLAKPINETICLLLSRGGCLARIRHCERYSGPCRSRLTDVSRDNPTSPYLGACVQ